MLTQNTIDHSTNGGSVNNVVKMPQAKVGCAHCPLKQFCLPQGLDKDQQAELECIIEQTQTLHKSRYLFRQGDHFDQVYMVKSGCLKTYQVSPDGEEQITGFSLPGDIIGLESLHEGEHIGTAKTLETSAVCSISFSKLTELATRVPYLQKHLFDLMSQGLQSDRKLLMLLSKKGASERVAAFLLSLSDHMKKRKLSESHFLLPMSRADIGNYLGLAIETVSRIFTKLQKQGVISCHNRELIIEDMDALRELAGQKTEDHEACCQGA